MGIPMAQRARLYDLVEYIRDKAETAEMRKDMNVLKSLLDDVPFSPQLVGKDEE